MNLIESLEPRIAPAAVFTFTDVDGDLVKITTSKGVNSDLANAAHVVGGQLQLLNLSAASFGAEFDHSDISITATPTAAGGDGHVNVGYLDATGRDLGKVSIAGDLGRLHCGSMTALVPGLKSLAVISLGALGTSTQAVGGGLGTSIQGSVGKVSVLGDIVGATLQSKGRLGALMVGGSVLDSEVLLNGGGDIIKIHGDLGSVNKLSSGRIQASADVASITVGGSLSGGTIIISGNLGTVKVGGSLVGRNGNSSGSIWSTLHIGSVVIGGDVRGGSGSSTGMLSAGGNVGSIKIGGDLVGGTGLETGLIYMHADLKTLTIGGSIIGGSTTAAGQQSDYTGAVRVGKLAKLTVGGNLLAGTQAAGSDLYNSGTIIATTSLGDVKIGGSISGSATTRVAIVTGGDSLAPGGLVLKSLTVGGALERTDILAGFIDGPILKTHEVKVGAINVGSWTASNLSAGVGAGADTQYGTGDDEHAPGGNPAIQSRIASIVIRGNALGSYAMGGDNYGIVAQQIGSMKIGTHLVPLKAGTVDILRIGSTGGVTGDFFVRDDV